MLNKTLPYFILWVFAALGCTSSFPVTFHGATFKDYLTGKRSQAPSYIPKNQIFQIQWQLVAFDDSTNTYMNGYNLKELNLMLGLTDKEYVPKYWKFNFPLYCNGSGVTNNFTASYEFDHKGNIRFSSLSPTKLVNTPEKQVIEDWYFYALNTAYHFSVECENPKCRKPGALFIYHENGVLIFKPVFVSPHSLPRSVSKLNGTSFLNE